MRKWARAWRVSSDPDGDPLVTAGGKDLERIANYIRQDSPEAAERVALALYEGVGRLREHPYSGRLGREQGTRELVYPGLPYLAVYEVRGEAVEILTILHSRQRWPR